MPHRDGGRYLQPRCPPLWGLAEAPVAWGDRTACPPASAYLHEGRVRDTAQCLTAGDDPPQDDAPQPNGSTTTSTPLTTILPNNAPQRSTNPDTPAGKDVLEERRGGGGGGSETQKCVYQKWPDQIFPMINFVLSRDGHFGLGGGVQRGGGGDLTKK